MADQDRTDKTLEDTFPASDPASPSPPAGSRKAEQGDDAARERDPHGTATHDSHRQGDPAGTPTSDRHLTETSHQKG